MEEIIVDVDLALDDDGFLDRQCPETRCRRYFKVVHSDWESSDTVVATCPFCGYKDEPSEFTTVEQEDYLRQIGESYAQELLQQLMGQLSNKLASSRGMLKVDVSSKFTDIPVPITPDAAESMRLQITCDTCGCTYAVVGSGFFCPLCGENSAPQSFHQAIHRVRSTVEVAEKLGQLLVDRAVIEATRASVLEDQIENLVTSFQRLADASYPRLPSATKLRNSPFQRLEQASEVWAKAGGREFTQFLKADEWSELLVYFQKRHVIGHRDGFVDDRYIKEPGDQSVLSGARLVITAANVLRMAELVETLGSGLISDLPDQPVPTSEDRSGSDLDLFPPQLPGTTELDWQIYRVICGVAVEKDHDNLSDADVVLRIDELGIDEEVVIESLEILKSKGLVELFHTMGSRIPRHIRLTRRGTELYYSFVLHDYKEQRLRLRDLLIKGMSMSHQMADELDKPILFVHTLLREFESRGLVSLHWSGGIAIVHVKSSAQLKRLA